MASRWTEDRHHAVLIKSRIHKTGGRWRFLKGLLRRLPVGWPGTARLRVGWGCGRCPRPPARRPGAAGSNPCCRTRSWTPRTGAASAPLPWGRRIYIYTDQYINTSEDGREQKQSLNLYQGILSRFSLENTTYVYCTNNTFCTLEHTVQCNPSIYTA